MTRARGEGSVSLHKPSGLYIAQVSLGTDASGKRLRKTAYGKTEADARAERDRMLREYSAGLDVNAAKVSVEEYLAGWVKHLDVTIRARQPRTYRSYADTVRLHISPRIGARSLLRLSPRDVETMCAQIAATGHTRTAQIARVVLRIALNDAIKAGILTRNVASLADAPTHAAKERPVLTLEQARRILANPHHLRACWALALGTGLRASVLCGLYWEDIDLARGSLTVQRQLQRIDGALIVRAVKTTSSHAPVPLAPFVVEALTKQRAARPAIKGFVFRTKTGKPYDRTELSKQWQRLCGRVGVPVVPLHSIRHTTATLLYAAGLPDKTIQTILRHAQISTTMDVYVKIAPEAIERATRAMQT
ncbi:MAG: site-specific integrase, partial [Chloroflexota bacterium]|nr:site-specific integrase [Chloroflexota bacterium]